MPVLKSFIRAGFGASSRIGKTRGGGGSAGASPKRGGLKPVYLGRLWCPYPEPRVFRAFQSTLLASPLLIRVPEATIRKCPIYKGLRGTYPETPYLRGVAGSSLEMPVDQGVPGSAGLCVGYGAGCCASGAACGDFGIGCCCVGSVTKPIRDRPLRAASDMICATFS